MYKGHNTYTVIFLLTILLSTRAYAEDTINYKALFENKKILITGGTGFIGRALITQILKHNPNSIIIFSRDEVKHYKVLEQFNDKRLQSILGDVRNYTAILDATKNVDLVIHAAALKRLDILEYNVSECIYTDALGSLNVARACVENKVPKALLVSSDKACMPVNAYGACKFISEKIFSNYIADKKSTCFVTVRYGNVLESTGSVIPFFCERIRNNESVPLTDPKMTRFFIAKEQAVELICKALTYGQGGEIFVPCLPAFKIIDLIAVLQQKIGKNNGITIMGLRPGEKFHELMINTTEVSKTYKFKDLYVITPSVDNLHADAAYIKDGQKLNISDLIEYSSRDAVMSQNDLSELLDEYHITL
jgi:UDP-N-acetylglucosamine 4,6-dehydratase/5-epimerase